MVSVRISAAFGAAGGEAFALAFGLASSARVEFMKLRSTKTAAIKNTQSIGTKREIVKVRDMIWLTIFRSFYHNMLIPAEPKSQISAWGYFGDGAHQVYQILAHARDDTLRSPKRAAARVWRLDARK